jgi:galactose mutarotase-like enzyme
MVGASLRHAGEELLDRRAGLRAYRERGAVMGVPLLHPWANRLARDELLLGGHRVRLPGPPAVWRDEHGLPIHGLLGAHPGWSVHEADADGHAARLIARLDFAADPRLTAVFPFPHDLVLEATLSTRSLRIATTVRATGAVAVLAGAKGGLFRRPPRSRQRPSDLGTAGSSCARTPLPSATRTPTRRTARRRQPRRRAPARSRTPHRAQPPPPSRPRA